MSLRRHAPLRAVFFFLAAAALAAAPVDSPDGIGPRAAEAQTPPELWLMAKGDSVLIHVPQPPRINHGFLVYRTGPDGEEELITPSPVRPIEHPVQAVSALGDARNDVMADLRVTGEVELLRRLQADAFTSGVMSMLYREVAQVLGRLHIDTGLAPGESYGYRVVFVDREGEETDEVRRGTVRVAEVLPGAPMATRAEADDHAITVRWSYPEYAGAATDFVHGFHVERAGPDGDFERVTRTAVVRGEPESLRWRDEEVFAGVTYRYRIRAIDMAGRLSEPGEEVEIAPAGVVRVSMPEHLVAEPGDGEVTLSWRISPEPSVIGYWVERSEQLEGPFERIVEERVPAEAPALRDRTVRGGTQYFYRVIAVDASGAESRPSNPISVVPIDETPPAPAAELAVEVEARRLRLSWSPSPSDDVRGYHIYRGDSPERLVRLTREPHPSTEYLDDGFEDEGLNPGARYTLRVVAVDHAFNESDPIELEVVIPDDVPPGPPTAFQASNIHGRWIELRWSPSGDLDIERYELTRVALRGGVGEAGAGVGAGAEAGSGVSDGARTLGEPVLIGVYAADALREARDTTVTRGERYRYELVAVDLAGNRGEPAVLEVDFRGAAPPPAPRHAAAVVTDGGVRVIWERVVARELVGYRVYRATIPTGVYEPISDVITDERVFVDSTGREGFYYTVRAVDASGHESRPSPAARAVER